MAFNTGNPVEPNGSTDPRDLKDNAAIIDKLVNSSDVTWTGRLGKPLKTWSGFEQDYNALMASMGFEPIHLVYTPGTPLSVARPTQLIDYNGSIYRAKVPTSFPLALTGVWATDAPKLVDVGDASLRQALAKSSDLSQGASMIGGVNRQINSLAQLKTYPGRYSGDQIDLLGTTAIGSGYGPLYWDAASTATANDIDVIAVTGVTTGRWIRPVMQVGGLQTAGYGNVRVGPIPVTTEYGPRDAVKVSRAIKGPTNCHAFADDTIIDGVTDYGGYGTFDALTQLRGTNQQDHIFSFQDRVRYSGNAPGTLAHWSGMILRPEFDGSGQVIDRTGIDLTGVHITGTGTMQSETGIRIRNLVGAAFNVGMRIDQSPLPGSFALYATGGASSHHTGNLSLGVVDQTSAKFVVTKQAGYASAFMDSTVDTASFGAVGDRHLGFYSNAALQMEIRNSSESNNVLPGVSNVPSLGTASRYWKGATLGTAVQVVSDATHKTDVRQLKEAEIATSKQLLKEIGIWQFLASVEDKGTDAARLHCSMTVQRAIKIFEDNGLDAFRYGFICFDKWDDEFVEHPAEVIEHPEVTRSTSFIDGNGQPIEVLEAEARTEIVKEAWREQTRVAGELYTFRETGILWFILAGLAE